MLNTFTGSGRTNRLGYLFTNMAVGLASVIAFVYIVASLEVDEMGEPVVTGNAMLGIFIVAILSTWLSTASAIRRFHDLGYTGWATLLLFVPILGVAAGLYLLFGPGNPTLNKYGPVPSPIVGNGTPRHEVVDEAELQAVLARSQAAREASYLNAEGQYDMEALFK